jgi:UDP-arabinose 4-epimerase
MKRVLVTGAAGYIGSHACKALARAGFEPIGLDSMERASVHEFLQGTLEIADTNDRAAVTRVLKRYAPVAVMHFAAYAYVGESVAKPALYYHNNVCGSLRLLEAMGAEDINKIVFSSTCATYGVPTSVPINEDHPQHPINPYGASKLMVECMLADFNRAYGLSYAALRYFNAAGADPECTIGECHEPETHAIPLAIRTALGERDVFEIYGTDYPTKDGTAIRDYIHVMDLAQAHVRALEYLLEGGASTALNLGTGTGHSVRDIVRAVESVTDRTVPVQLSPRRAGDPPLLVADPTRARQVLGWRADTTDLVRIVRTAVDWHRKWRAHQRVQRIAGGTEAG